MWIATGSVPTQAAAGSVAAVWKDRLHSVRLTCCGVRKVLLLTYAHSTRHFPGEPMHQHFLLIAQNTANI